MFRGMCRQPRSSILARVTAWVLQQVTSWPRPWQTRSVGFSVLCSRGRGSAHAWPRNTPHTTTEQGDTGDWRHNAMASAELTWHVDPTRLYCVLSWWQLIHLLSNLLKVSLLEVWPGMWEWWAWLLLSWPGITSHLHPRHLGRADRQLQCSGRPRCRPTFTRTFNLVSLIAGRPWAD